MSSLDSTPTYNLKAVVQETGLKPDTLRAWERRYGLPEPRRTPSGHRIYSQRDIDILLWLMERQEEGLSISRAVALWHQLREAGEDPLGATDQAESGDAQSGSEASMDLPTGGRAHELRQAWITACLAFDELRAEKVLEEAFSLFAPETVCIEILQRGLAELGMGWVERQVTPQQEHFASSLAMQRLQSLLSSTPPPVRAERIMIGCASNEEHVFAPMLISLILRRKGWHVIYLGANVPARNLEATVTAAHPTLVLLTAQQLHTAAALQRMAEVLYRLDIPVAYGGRIFTDVPEIRKSIPGYFLGNSIEAAVQNFEKIALSPRLKPADKHMTIAQEYAQARFQEQRGAIESEVWSEMQYQGMDSAAINSANEHFGRTILSAMQLCYTRYLSTDAAWLQDMLINQYDVSPEISQKYLEVYMEALCKYTPEYGQLITNHVHGQSSVNGKQPPATSKSRQK